MAARDNVLFGAATTTSMAAGTVLPLSLVHGIENVRQGYGTPRLKSVRAFYSGTYTKTSPYGLPISIKNSNWIDSAGVIAQKYQAETVLDRESLGFMRGRDKVLQPNTAWSIQAEFEYNVAAAGYVWVLLEIEYSDVPGISTENAAGSPVMKTAKNASVTAAAVTLAGIGTFDNLLQGVTYVLSEVSGTGLSDEGAFVIFEGFSNQKGLTRIIPVKDSGLAEPIEGSVYLTKQTYNLSVINYAALSAATVSVKMEMVASSN